MRAHLGVVSNCGMNILRASSPGRANDVVMVMMADLCGYGELSLGDARKLSIRAALRPP